MSDNTQWTSPKGKGRMPPIQSPTYRVGFCGAGPASDALSTTVRLHPNSVAEFFNKHESQEFRNYINAGGQFKISLMEPLNNNIPPKYKKSEEHCHKRRRTE